MIKQKFTIVFSIAIILIMFFIAPLWATTLSINLPAGDQTDHTITLRLDDHVRIKFNVLGTENNYVAFSLVYPDSSELNFGEVGVFSYEFVCEIKGEYQMCFVNNDLEENKLVTLNYDVEAYMFGLPQTQFLVIAIAVVCVMMVAFYSILSPHP